MQLFDKILNQKGSMDEYFWVIKYFIELKSYVPFDRIKHAHIFHYAILLIQERYEFAKDGIDSGL